MECVAGKKPEKTTTARHEETLARGDYCRD
jgi:hypothetical protein